MKTKIKRHSRSVLSVVLAISMLVSCMMVGIIATDAAYDNSEKVGANYYGSDREYLYVDMTNSNYTLHGVKALWDNGNEAIYIMAENATEVSPGIYKFKLSSSSGNGQYYYNFSSFVVDVNDGDTWENLVMAYNADNCNCIKVNGSGSSSSSGSRTWETYFNLWYGGSDTGLNESKLLVPGGIDFPLTTSNTFINVVNAAYGSWNSAGRVWSSSDTIDDMIASDDNIIFKERKDQNSTTYYALIKAKNSAAAKYSQVLTYSSSDKQLTITSNPPASYDIEVDDANDCTILAEYNGDSATNGETLTGVFVDETVSITVTPNLESKKVTAISATGAGNAVTGLTNNGDGTYSATLTVAAAGKISATLEDKARYTVTLNQASNGTATATVGGVAQESPFTVYEDTSVTFTAEPDEGYAFTGWSGSFTDKTSTVAKTITGTTTVTPTYAVDGYKMLFSENGTKAGTVVSNMIKLPNGHWISASPIPKTGSSYNTNLFTIQRIRDGYYVHSGATGNSFVINNGNHIDLSNRWYEADVKDYIDHQFYSNNYIADAYLVYAPEENKLYLTDNDGDHGDVAILAKDGTIRDWSGKTFTSDFGDTHITYVDGTAITGEDDGVVEYNQYSYKTNDSDNNTARAEYVKFKGAAVNKGVTIKVKTTVNETYAALGYYVKGFVVSTEEESYAVINQEFGDDSPYNELSRGSYSSSDVYDKIHGVKSGDEYTTLPYNEFNFTIKGYPTTGIEITPIYYVAEAKSGDNVRFYVEGFEGEVKEKWTNMLAVDVYGESARPFGEYPGQPMLKYNGRYVVDIPRNDIRGITLNNYYWDKVHSYYYGVTTNYQTYDYNDFVYINDMLTAHGKDEDIVFSFRYKRNASHNSQATSNLADRVYYKDSEAIYGSGKTEYDDHTVHADDYRTGYTTMTAAHEAMYDFEPLTDFYGNRVDVFGNLVDTEANATKAAYNPLRIVSNGYDLNKAGRFATAWAFYKPNSWTAADAGTYTLADIVGGQGKTDQSFQSESFLIDPDSEARVRFKYDASIRDDTTLASTKYTDAVGDETILGYWQRKFRAQNNNSTSYPSLVADLAGVPAVITYEYEVGDEMPNKDLNSTVSGNDKNYAYRSDGRWFYSSADELVQAHVIVEYADREGGTFVRDYFQTESHDYTSGENYVPSANTGLATGIKAYFTNNGTEEREGKTFSNTYGYTEANGITDGKYTFDLETVGDEDGNYSFVGWYMLINGEYSFVTKDEELISEATNNDVYVARYVKVPSGNLQITHALTSDSAGDATCYVKAEIYESDGTTLVDNTSYPYTTSAIKIDTKYIKANSNRKVKITLKTVLGSNTTFDQFKEKVGETLNQLTAESTLGLTATVSIDTSGTDMYAYITFPISALFDEDGNQTVKSTPFFSKTHLPEYKYEITYNFGSRKLIQNGKLSNTRLWGDQFYKYKGTFTDEEVEQYLDLSGTPTFKSAETANYLAEHSPYEKNFLEDTVWDFNSQTISYNASTLTFSCSLTAAQTTNTDINVTFMLPFDYTLNTTTPNNYTFSVTKASETDKPVYKDYKTVTQHESVTMDFLDWFSLNGVKNKTQMTSENQPEFLKVPDVLYNDATNPTKKRTFKYWAFFKEGDNIDTAGPYQKCYSSALNQAVYQDTIFYPVYSEELEMSEKEIKEVASNKSATITFLGVTRDQWNYDGGGTQNVWNSKFADRIFTDFVLSFEYENKLIRSLGNNYKTGLIIETLDTPAGGIANATPESLATTYASNDGKDDAITKIKNTASDISESGVGTYLISYNQQALDDRNAIEYYYGIANVSQSTNPTNDTYTTPTNRRNYGYRAYSFIKKGTGNSAEVIISDPVYFTIYDVASIRNGSEQVASGS